MKTRLYTSLFLLLFVSASMSSIAWGKSGQKRYDVLWGTKDPYLGKHNEKATLAWGASYHLLSYVVMFEFTGDERYLDRAVRLSDSLLKQRDDKRNVKDYRGISGACWRNLHYQPKQQPYCYVVHSGMITYPMVRMAESITKNLALGRKKAYDGQTYHTKATSYLARAEETVKAHADQWKQVNSSRGYYIFRKTATFLRFAGKAMPLNQQNTLGRTLAVLSRVTKKSLYINQTKQLCNTFKAYTKLQGRGLVWNYWPTTYKSPGEDISHAALNTGFAVECQKSGVAFSSGDILRIAFAFFDYVYQSTTAWKKFVGGGAVDSTYAIQIGRWLPVTAAWPPLYGAIRSYYDILYGSKTSASSGLLLSHAYLAAYEPEHTYHNFYVVDWADKGAYQQATKYGANLVVKPIDPKKPALVSLTYASFGAIELQQWDGKKYQTIRKLPNTSGKKRQEWFVYTPRFWFSYYKGQALFQFKDAAFVNAKGIRVWKSIPPPKPEPVVEPKPEPQREPPGPEPQRESKSEPQPEPQRESKPEPKPEPQSETSSEPIENDGESPRDASSQPEQPKEPSNQIENHTGKSSTEKEPKEASVMSDTAKSQEDLLEESKEGSSRTDATPQSEATRYETGCGCNADSFPLPLGFFALFLVLSLSKRQKKIPQ